MNVEMKKIEGAIFDLDGVVVDTAKYHYLAWKKLSEQLNIEFTEEDNEKFKGVSRMRCMEILCEMGSLQISEDEKIRLATKKNEWYVEFINNMDDKEMFSNVEFFIKSLRNLGIKISLGSASKNAMLILEKLGITELFDAVIDGTKVTNAKPDPEVFLRAARELGASPESCVVFEDAFAGVQAANRGGMMSVGIGDFEVLKEADIVLASPEGMVELLPIFEKLC